MPNGRSSVTWALRRSSMARAYLALGSNLGDRQRFLDAAVARLRAVPGLDRPARLPVLRNRPRRRPGRVRGVSERRRRGRHVSRRPNDSFQRCWTSNVSSAASAPNRTLRGRSTSTCSCTTTWCGTGRTRSCRTRECTSGGSSCSRWPTSPRTSFTRPSRSRSASCSTALPPDPEPPRVTRDRDRQRPGVDRPAGPGHRLDQRDRQGHRPGAGPRRGRRDRSRPASPGRRRSGRGRSCAAWDGRPGC